jgi:hypothetical protein
MKKLIILTCMIFLFGCKPEPIKQSLDASFTVINTIHQSTFIQTPIRTQTLSVPMELPSFTKKVTQKEIPTSINTPTLTLRPTPTQELLPTFTLNPRESCPPPTFSKVDIGFEDDIANYGPKIVEYIRANGDKAGLKEKLERLGINKDNTGNEGTGGGKKVFVPDVAQFTEADMTGDQVKETIVILKQMYSFPVGAPAMAIFIVGCRSNQYQLLGSFVYTFTADAYTKLDDIRDLNANGINEFVISVGSYSGYPQVDVYSYVLEWDGVSFRSLLDPTIESEDSSGNWSDWNLPELKDMDGNGTIELLLPRYRQSFCDELTTKWSGVYMWDGEYYRYMWMDPGDPQYRFQTVFSGDYYSAISLYDRSETQYRKAINDSTLKRFSNKDWRDKNNIGECKWEPYDPDEPQRIISYARFRLVELLVFLKKMNSAESLVIYLDDNNKETTPGYRYALLAITFWNAYQVNKNIGDACKAVRYEAAQHSEEIFGSLDYETGGLSSPTLENICPFHSDK